jgi:hypothetical protein
MTSYIETGWFNLEVLQGDSNLKDQILILVYV